LIDDPVPLEDYLKAVEDMRNDRIIGNPKIPLAPAMPQQIMTIGHICDLLAASFTKIGLLLKKLDSHSKITVEKALATYM